MSKKLSTLRRGSVQAPFPKIIVIVGPTGSGKTDLAIKIARKFNAEIISADSRQIYRGMDIGTAKPRISFLKQGRRDTKFSVPKQSRGTAIPVYSSGIPHHLINIKNPNQPYTVSQYKKDAIRAIRKILAKNKIPILVGGTGLYVKAVIDNLSIPKVKPNLRLREKLEKDLRKKGLNYLYEKLIKLDPEAAYIIDPKNPRRVIRALEITLTTNKPFSQQRKMGKKLFNSLKIGVNPPKQKLKARIEKRVDQMIRGGLIDEVKNLIKKYPANLATFDAIGYREIIDYFRGEMALPHAVALIKRNTWRYAKRQMTWFGKDKETKWIKNKSEAVKLVRNFITIP